MLSDVEDRGERSEPREEDPFRGGSDHPCQRLQQGW